MYISRDVIFDETIFPFSSQNPNASTLLRSEVLLLPENTPSNSIDDEGEQVVDQ